MRPTGRDPTPRRRRLLFGAAVILLLPLFSCDRAPPADAARTNGGSDFPLSLISDERFPAAGISAKIDVKIEPLRHRELGADTLLPAYRLLIQRCAGCHSVPDPGSKSAEEWAPIVARMNALVNAAGLLPTTPEELSAIVTFLERRGS